MLRLASRIGLGLATEQYCSLQVCSRWGFWGNAPWNLPRAEALPSRPAEVAATALRAVVGLASRRAESPTAAMILQRAELVALMAPQTVAAASEREKTI